MKLRQLTKFGSAIPATLSTPEATADDETGAAEHMEYQRYERAILDFEHEVRKRRDAMRREHLENMRIILSPEEEQAAE